MGNFHIHLIANSIFVMMTTACDVSTSNKDNEVVDRQLPSSRLAVTSCVGAGDLYGRIKKRFPRSYVDNAELQGPLRGEDYQGMYLGTIFYGMLPMKHPFVHESPTREERAQDLADKSRICARVFDSPLFEMNDEDVVNFDLETKEPADLLQQDRSTYEDIYGEVDDEASNHRPRWLNPYRRYVVKMDGEDFKEYFFRCVTRKRSSSDDNLRLYKVYFVSPIYRSWYPENFTMVGRFVFTDDLRTFALAEEPARVDNNVIEKTQRAYFDAYEARVGAASINGEGHSQEDKMSNVLCRLSMSNKIRFCAIVLNAIDFPEKVVFQPLEESVEAECTEKRISTSVFEVERKPESPWYTYAQYKPVKEDVLLSYSELVIGCKAIRQSNPETNVAKGQQPPSTITYYVSRGVDVYTAIIYKLINDEIYSPYLGLDWVHFVQGAGVVTMKHISVLSRTRREE